MKNYEFYNSPVGNLLLISEDDYLVGLYFNNHIDSVKIPDYNNLERKETKIIEKTKYQLEEYFKEERKYFDLPLKFTGTEFQKSCWEGLLKIPYGETRSYKEMAELVNSPKAYRAVGNANNKNPISIIAPCHRVIGSSGKLVGFGGGLDIKESLLNLEKENNKKSL